MTAAVLCTGTELTRGELVNTNATWLADALSGLGFEVSALDSVADDRASIEQALVRLGSANEVLICTGGLGPTTDDLTTECAARVLGVTLLRDEASLRSIEDRLSRFGRKIAASNAKQADFPVGSRIIPNPNGTAPGFVVTIGKALAFFLPGVPSEMRAMFEASIAPAIAPLVRDRIHQTRLRTFGLPESEVNDRLAGIEADHDVVIGYRAKMPEIEVKVLARDTDAATARARSGAAAAEVRKRLGDEVVFGEGAMDFAEAIGALLMERNLSLATAESCTGGLVAELLTANPGSSRYFLGGVVAYENQVKTRLLDVPAELLQRVGAVSSEVAVAMARGALERLHTGVALSITGIAGPSGGTTEKPVGLVHYAVATSEGTSERHRVFTGNREAIRRRAAFAALALVREVLLHGHRSP